MIFNHGWTRINTDGANFLKVGRVTPCAPNFAFTRTAGRGLPALPANSYFIRVHPCPSVVNFFCGKMKFKLTIAYDGTAYEGWQVQKTGTGVQEKVEAALAKLFPGKPRLHGASRTDTGVHALGMVAHFEIPAAEFRDVHAQTCAGAQCLAAGGHPCAVGGARAGKISRAFRRRRQAIPLFRLEPHGHESVAAPQRVAGDASAQPEAMRAAAPLFVGRHNFKSFAASRNYEMASTVRTLTRCDIRKSGPLLTFIIEGDGFLYKMCRGIIGTLVQTGLGKFPADEIRRMLAKKDRRVAGMTAPAKGLVLWKVFYPKFRSSRREEAPI